MKRSLGTTPDGLVQTFEDVDDDICVVKSTQDIEPVLKRNAELRNDGTGGWSPTREWKRVASIPTIVIEAWCKSIGVTMREWMSDERLQRRFIADPDNKNFRTDQ